jgi:hypothetical protein
MNSKLAELKGSQTPRVATVPKAKWTYADDAAFLATSYGLTPDPWQMLCLESFLGVRSDGRWSASRCGLAVPRQNGKNGVVEIVELFLTVALGYKILHTAHEVKTARKAFLRLISFFENEREYPELAAMVKEIRRTNGQEAIVLTNGGSVEFIARSKGSGRGFTVDCLVLDECQELSEEAMAALRPTISSAPKGDPKIIFTGTPPSPTMDGAYWQRLRAKGLKGTDKRLAWLEWSLDGKVDLDDLANVAATNPSLGIRLNLDVIRDERADMDDVTYARERLGMWDSDEDLRVISQSLWDSRATSSPPTTGGVVVFALDASPNLEYVSIVAARKVGDTTHVELIEHGSAKNGTQWVLDFFADPKRRRNELVIDFYCPLSFLAPDLQKMGVKVTIPKVDVVAADCAAFVNAVNESRMTHFDQIQLNKAVAGASKRTVRETLWMWNRKTHDVDITPLVAATLAHGHAQRARVASTAGPRRIY